MTDDRSSNGGRFGTKPVVWHTSRSPVAFRDAESFMRQRVEMISRGDARELIWLLEHPSIYTAGTSAVAKDLLIADRFPVYETGRGGQYTYHGPGQRIVYVMLDLTSRGGRDVRGFVDRLQNWIIETLATFGVRGETRDDRVGIWVGLGDGASERDEKIAAVGIRLFQWISLHGISVNVSVDLAHYEGIVSCGIHDHGITSLKSLGVRASLDDVDQALKASFCGIFSTELVDAAPLDGVRDFS